MNHATMHGCNFVDEHERAFQRRGLEDYFAARSRKEDLLFSMPRLVLGDSPPRAKAHGVYVLSQFDVKWRDTRIQECVGGNGG